jgi:hypothetical protein
MQYTALPVIDLEKAEVEKAKKASGSKYKQLCFISTVCFAKVT